VFLHEEKRFASVVTLLDEINEIFDRLGSIVFEKLDDDIPFGCLDTNLRVIFRLVFLSACEFFYPRLFNFIDFTENCCFLRA